MPTVMGLFAHALKSRETELVADDEGDEAQRYLGDKGQAVHLLEGAEADAKITQAQTPQKERPQQQARQQIRCDRRQMDRLCEARHQKTCDERCGKADEKLFHAILRAAARYRRAAALSSFFSVGRVFLLLAKSPKNTAQ